MLKRGLLLVYLLLVAQAALAQIVVGRIVAVADGDTVTLLDQESRQHKIRFVGIDAPEKAQSYGRRSKAVLSSLIFGKAVEADCVKRDRYGRELCKILLNGADINLEQVRAGMAWWYRKYAKEQSKADQVEYERAEIATKTQRLGLWADENPTPPWEWRHRLKAH